MKIKPFLIASIAAITLYASSFSTAKTIQLKSNIAAVSGLENKLAADNELKLAFDNRLAAFTVSERLKLAGLLVQIGNTAYAINDGCPPDNHTADCQIDHQPDFCSVVEDNIIQRNLFDQKAEAYCGDLYRKTKEAFLDYHVKKIKELLKTTGTSITFGVSNEGLGQAVMITDEKTTTYTLFDEDGDGVVESMSLYYASNPELPIIFIEKNTSKSIQEKIGGLYNFVEEYVKTHQ